MENKTICFIPECNNEAIHQNVLEEYGKICDECHKKLQSDDYDIRQSVINKIAKYLLTTDKYKHLIDHPSLSDYLSKNNITIE